VGYELSRVARSTEGPSLYLPCDGRGRREIGAKTGREIGAKTESQPLRSWPAVQPRD